MKHNHAHQINLSGLLDFHGIEEAKQIRKAVTIGCIVNILLLVIKLVFGYCGHSDALVADGYHSLGDVGSDLVMLTFVGISFRKASSGFAYGYGKFETFASMVISGILIFIAVMVTKEAIESIQNYVKGFGSIIYQTTLPELANGGFLTVNDPHDYAQVFVDGKYIGTLDRRNGEKQLSLPPCKRGARLDIFVEAMGRINFGRAIKDFKGITDNVTVTEDRNGYHFTCELKNWKVYNIEDEYECYKSYSYAPIESVSPDSTGRLPRGVYVGTFNINKPADTFLSFEKWGKGLVYVNGHGIGRIWEIGPQQTLYVPGTWLKKGENEVLVFDIMGPKEAVSFGSKTPELDKLLVKKPLTHREPGQELDLEGSKPVVSSSLTPGNGWKEISFGTPATGRYVCLEAVNSHDGKDRAAIAEMYLLDNNNERISREPWVVMYADSEDVEGVNRSADKTFDLQESTYWSTKKKDKFPHFIVIDLGKEHTLTGLQCLPRMESNAPSAIKDIKVYVSSVPFKF